TALSLVRNLDDGLVAGRGGAGMFARPSLIVRIPDLGVNPAPSERTQAGQPTRKREVSVQQHAPGERSMATVPNPFEVGLEKNAANYAPLSPLSFISWSAHVFPQRVAVIHGQRRYTWSETYARCRRLASALGGMGIGKG